MATKKSTAVYGETIPAAFFNGDTREAEKFDAEGLMYGQGLLTTSSKPDRKAMRYLGKGDLSDPNFQGDFDVTKAGAGRGKQGGPTAKEVETKAKGGMTKAYAKGGSVSARADGIAQRGKTRGRMC